MKTSVMVPEDFEGQEVATSQQAEINVVKEEM
jgi:hypothetical protein